MNKRDAAAAATLADPRWPQVLARAADCDGLFYFAVKTTGVYCRPACSARTPRPENVLFFADTASARAAGFRACRRCRPDSTPPADAQAALVAELCRRIDAADAPIPLAALAAQAGLSPAHLHRLFKRITGVTPKAWADAARATRLRAALARGERVTAAGYDAGFSSSSRLHAQARSALGMQPRQFRAGGAQLAIRYALTRCELGDLLVAASDQGVCAILFGDDPAALRADLAQRFPQATLSAGDAAFAALVAQVVALVETPGAGLGLPLDLRGTAFQQRVWRALREIPSGSTASYAEIAARIGAPGSARAVAQACAANRLAVAVPCHRVVRQDGELSGYRWGVARKRALLAREAREPGT